MPGDAQRLPADNPPPAYPSLLQISDRQPPVDWLWPYWIPRGFLTLFGAAPGAGKSLVALDLARRVIHGGTFPDGAPVPCPGRCVLFVDAEGPPALLNHRAQAWGVDRSRLFLLRPPDPGGAIDLADMRQQLLLIEMMRDLRPALIVVDSLAAATARAETSLQGARALLGNLAAIAHVGQLGLLLIHHLRKPAATGRTPARRVTAADLRGSSHLAAAARSILALSSPVVSAPTASGPGLASASPQSPESGTDSPAFASDATPSAPEATAAPDSTTPAPPSPESVPDLMPGSPPGAAAEHPHPHHQPQRCLEIIKTNLCQPPPPLGLVFEGVSVPVPTLRYSAYVEPPPQPTQLDLCAHWLLQFLAAAGEPVKPLDVVRAAREEGFPRTTLYRARHALGGSVIDLGNSPYDPTKRWTLAPGPPHHSKTGQP
jgi:hypothetical protein